jgi:oxalate decarboxylase/phosphoglucose isomerase-like protein (cupin superfamily)
MTAAARKSDVAEAKLPTTLHPAEVETIVAPWVTAKTMAAPSVSGSARMAAVSLYFKPGQGHARHNHPDSEQIIHVISGTAEMMIEDEAGKPVLTRLTAGSTVTIPQGAFHSTFNIGWDPVQILAIYSPPGPELAMKGAREFVTLPVGVLPTGK